MNTLRYSIERNESLSRWLITDMEEKPFDSPNEAFYHPVNMREDYIQVIYPVRKAFLAQNDLSKVASYDGSFSTIYFPLENSRVDRSTFRHNPTELSLNARAWLSVDKDGTYPFCIYTCGAVKIWVDGEEVLTFAPFTRDVASKTGLELTLSRGTHQVDVFAQELAERDVFFYYEMRYLGEGTIYGELNIEEDPAEIRHAEELLFSLGFERDEFTEGPVRLFYNPKAVYKENLELTVSSDPSGIFPTLNGAKVFNLCSDKDSLEIADVNDCRPGSWAVECGVKVQDRIVTRLLNTSVRKPLPFKAAKTQKERKLQALEFIEEYGENVVNKALVRIYLGHEKPGHLSKKALECIDESLRMIEDKSDCADFYLAPMLVLVKHYPEYLDEALRKRIDNAVLNFRYWMDELGNDSMWWFSENHAFLFHLCQYAAGMLYDGQTFRVSGKTAKEVSAIGRQRVVDWYRSFFDYGIAEWNSATYVPVDLIGLFSLRALTEDREILDLTDRAIDFIFKMIAVNSIHGEMNSSFGRAYEDTLKYRFQVEPCFLNWVAYGEGNLTRGTRAVSLYCMSDYEAPDYRLPATRDGYELKVAQAKEKVNTYNFVTKNYSLSCVQNFRPFTHGHQQHLMNAAFGDKPVQFFINNPGERVLSGQNRPSYWAGNGTMPLIHQKYNTLLMVYDIDPEELVQAIHAYCPIYSYDAFEQRGNWAFIRSDDAYLAAFLSEGFEVTDKGPNKGRELFSKGSRHAVVVRLSDVYEYETLQDFEKAMMEAALEYDLGKRSLSFTDPAWGRIDVNAFEGDYDRVIEPVRIALPISKKLIEDKMALTLEAFKKVLYQQDAHFMENMKTRNLAGDDISRYRFWEWPQGVGLFAIYQLYSTSGSRKYLDILTEYYDQRIKEGLPAKNINTMAPILALTYLAKETGSKVYRDIVEEWATWAMEELPRTEEGGFQHITSDSVNHNELWDDTLFMAVCTLAKAGELLGRQDFLDEATRQCLLHIKYLQDPETGLWFHGWTFDGNHNFAKALWGRGNCWITISFPIMLGTEGFARDPEDRKRIEDSLRRQIEALCRCQDPSGMWHTLLVDSSSYVESSATCGFGCGLILASSLGCASAKALECARRALVPILGRIDSTGVIADVSYGTPMGRKDQDFYKEIPLENTPYGPALALLFLSMAQKMKK